MVTLLTALLSTRSRLIGAEYIRRLANDPSALIVASTGVQSALRMVSNILLARLLAPNAFALMAITSMILTGITMVSDVGIAITALREGVLSREEEDKLWTMQLVRGACVGLLMAASAVPVGWLYADTRLRDVCFALALVPILSGLQSLSPIMALAHRRLLPSVSLEIAGRVGGIVLSVLIALVSPTVWSLVIGTLTGLIVSVIGSHIFARRAPHFIFDLNYMTRQWRFSRWIQTSSTLTFFGGQIDKAVFPFLYGMTLLGVYGISSTFSAIPAQITQRWSASVFYPLTVQLLKRGTEERRQLMALRRSMLLYTFVIALAIAAISRPFFLLLYPPSYEAAARFSQILAAGVFFETAESSLRHLPLVEATPHFEAWVVITRLIAFGLAVSIIYSIGANAYFYALAYVLGLAVGHAFMLSVCVKRGYLQPKFDLEISAALVALLVAIWFLPQVNDRIWLSAWSVTVGILGATALVMIFKHRGFPSLAVDTSGQDNHDFSRLD